MEAGGAFTLQGEGNPRRTEKIENISACVFVLIWYKEEDLAENIDAVNDECFVACLDIGHAEMRGAGSGAAAMIYALKDRLQALHIHDNDRQHDLHQIPFSMSIDFNAVVKALKDIGYQGYLTLEADRYLQKYSEDSIFKGIKNLASAAGRLAEMFK